MKKKRLVGITFSATYQQYEQIRDLSRVNSMSASELIRIILADYLDNVQQTGGMLIEEE